MLLHGLGYTTQVLTCAGSRRALPSRHKFFYQSNLDKRGKTIRDFLALAFTEPTREKYALTTAIAEVHLRGDGFSGLLYPAISKAANVDNLALRPEFVRKGLKLAAAQLVKIDKIEKAGSVGGLVVCDLSYIDDNESLHWTFCEKGTSIPPGGSRSIRQGEKLRAQTPGEIEVEGKRYKIDTGYSIELNESGELIIRDLRGNLVEPNSLK